MLFLTTAGLRGVCILNFATISTCNGMRFIRYYSYGETTVFRHEQNEKKFCVSRFSPTPSHRRRCRHTFLPFTMPLPSRNDPENCLFINTRRRFPGDTFRQPFVMPQKIVIIWKTKHDPTPLVLFQHVVEQTYAIVCK